MNDIAELYQELIIDHSSRPRNFKAMAGAQRSEGFNPLCGDRVTVYVRMDGDVVADASFQGEGCAISRASASLMTEAVKGKTLEAIGKLFTMFHGMATGASSSDSSQLGKLSAFSGLHEFPARVKCGTLAWRTLLAALKQDKSLVSTE